MKLLKLPKLLGGKPKENDVSAKRKNGLNSTDLNTTSSGQIKIKIYKEFGSTTNFLKDVFIATEKRDLYGNLISINEKENHNEDIDFSMDDVYTKMNIILEFGNKNQNKKEEILNKKIERQQKLIQLLEKYVELNAVYNFPDESIKLRDYQLLLDYVKHHDGKGSYFSIEGGFRVYSFVSSDGFLIPIWHGVTTVTQYPDHTIKKKIMQQEDLVFAKQMAEYKRDKMLQNTIPVVLSMCILLFLALGFMAFKAYGVWEDAKHVVDDSTMRCADSNAKLLENMNTLQNIACVKEYIADVDAENELKEDYEEPPDLVAKITNLVTPN